MPRVITIPASSGAVAAHLEQCETGSQPLPTCCDIDNRLGGSVDESHVRPTEVDIQDTAISSDGGGQDLVRDNETQAAVEVFAMSECSDTESCGEVPQFGRARSRRRLRLVWDDPQSDAHVHDGRAGMSGRHEVLDSHDQRFVRVSRQMQRERREVHAASQFIRTVAARVGFVDEGGTVPRLLRHQQWSAFNVPLMWAAASGDADCHLLQWLEARAERLPPMRVGDEQISGCATVRTSWEVLRNSLQSWGITSREHLAEWIHNQGFRSTPVGSPLQWQGARKDSEWSSRHGRQRSWFGGGIREHRLGCVQTRTTGREAVAGREPSCRFEATCCSDVVGILGRSEFAGDLLEEVQGSSELCAIGGIARCSHGAWHETRE